MNTTFGTYGSLGAFGESSSYGAAPSGSNAVADFMGSGGYGYRAFVAGSNLWFQIVKAPKGYVTGTLVYSSNPVWASINTEYQSYRKLPPYTIGSTTTGASSPSASTQPKKLPPTVGDPKEDAAKPTWLESLTGIMGAATPLVQGIVGGVQSGTLGGGGSPAAIAAQIAAKQQRLANTTNPVAAAKLQAEIQQLQQQQAMYQQSVGTALDAGLGGGGGGGGSTGSPSWLWPVVIGIGVLGVGGVLFASMRGGKR